MVYIHIFSNVKLHACAHWIMSAVNVYSITMYIPADSTLDVVWFALFEVWGENMP